MSKKFDKPFSIIADDISMGKRVNITSHVILGTCKIGDETKIKPFVQIESGAIIGKRCKIESHTFICDGVEIGNYCFIGHGVIFANDNHPRSVNSKQELETEKDWKPRFVKTIIGKNVTIGSGAKILGGISIGDNAMIGMGSVVTKNVPENQVWVGCPAKFLKNKNI